MLSPLQVTLARNAVATKEMKAISVEDYKVKVTCTNLKHIHNKPPGVQRRVRV